jgi:hypothetical protein
MYPRRISARTASVRSLRILASQSNTAGSIGVLSEKQAISSDVGCFLLRSRNYDRRQPNPLATRCAVIVEVETRVIGKKRQAASDQHRNKKEVEKVTVAHP